MDFKRLTTRQEVKDLVDLHNSNSEFLVLDTETTNKNPRKATLLDIQLSGVKEESVVIFSAEFRDCLIRIEPQVTLVAHSYKYDAHVLFRHGVDLLRHTWRDTLLLAHIQDENRESYSLDSFVKEMWNDDYKEKFWTKYKAYEEATEKDKIEYACKDVIFTGRLYRDLVSRLAQDRLSSLLIDHVHRLQSALLYTELSGIKVDLPYLRDLGVRIKRRITEIEPQMRSLVKDEIEVCELIAWSKEIDKRKTGKGRSRVPRPVFSFGSSQQLQSLLYTGLGLPPQRNEKTKKISTDFACLEKIKEAHPVVTLIQENRELQKVYGTYVEGTLDRVDNERIYPEFRVAGTVTGRLSHSNPNLAQLPKTGGVRGIYVPDRGRVLISADYSQLEVVIEAHLTRDKNLLRILKDGVSKHDITAAELGCSRDLAKTINFASQYHCTHFKIAKLFNCDVNEGLRIWKRYWEIYAGPKRLKDQTDKEIDAGVPLVTCYGRKRRFPPGKRQPWSGDYRQGYNFKIQSPGADFTSEAFYLTSETLQQRGWGRGLFTVHDECLIEVDKNHAEESEVLLIANMESMATKYNLSVPLKAQGSGPQERWED